jgi:HNH endonuclease
LSLANGGRRRALYTWLEQSSFCSVDRLIEMLDELLPHDYIPGDDAPQAGESIEGPAPWAGIDFIEGPASGVSDDGLTNAGSYCHGHQPKTGRGSTRQWRNLRKAVFARYGRTCVYCGRTATHIDHVVPVASGGTDDLANLRPACGACNMAKGASQMGRRSGATPAPAPARAGGRERTGIHPANPNAPTENREVSPHGGP